MTRSWQVYISRRTQNFAIGRADTLVLCISYACTAMLLPLVVYMRHLVGTQLVCA